MSAINEIHYHAANRSKEKSTRSKEKNISLSRTIGGMATRTLARIFHLYTQKLAFNICIQAYSLL